MIEKIIKVENMKCEGCEKRIVRILEEIEGVIGVQADYKTGKITIQSRDEFDMKELKEILENLDFPIIED